MDSDSKIKILRQDIRELEQIKQTLLRLEEKVVTIEKAVCAIDESIPADMDIEHMREGREKSALMEISQLTAKAFELVDDILGAPDGEDSGEYCDSPDSNELSAEASDAVAGASGRDSASLLEGLYLNGLTPESRGNSSASLEAALTRFSTSGGKNTTVS